MGVRIAANLIVESKVLAARQKRRLNELVEEALQDLATWMKTCAALEPPGGDTTA